MRFDAPIVCYQGAAVIDVTNPSEHVAAWLIDDTACVTDALARHCELIVGSAEHATMEQTATTAIEALVRRRTAQ